jgi:hypothetical protein
MRNQLLLVIGLVVGSYLPAEAQTSAKQILLAQRPTGRMMLLFRPSQPNYSSPAVFLTTSLPPKSLGRFTRMSTATYEPELSLESRFSIVVNRTPFRTESSMPVTQLWGKRLQVEGFSSTLRRYPQFWSSGVGHDSGLPSPDQAAAKNRRGDLYGLSLRFEFGKAPTSRPPQIWRYLGSIVGKGK